MEDLIQFLRDRNVPDEVVQKMVDDHVSIIIITKSKSAFCLPFTVLQLYALLTAVIGPSSAQLYALLTAVLLSSVCTADCCVAVIGPSSAQLYALLTAVLLSLVRPSVSLTEVLYTLSIGSDIDYLEWP